MLTLSCSKALCSESVLHVSGASASDDHAPGGILDMDSAVTTRLAHYAAATRYGDLPEAVRGEAVRSMFNILGCTLGGARHHGVDIADAALRPFTGAGVATLIGRGRKADALHATLINCLASSIYSFDDTHAQAVVHPSGPVASAALALAEHRPVSGQALLTAFALGVELECRLCKALTVPPAKGSMAWSGTGITGGIGAAVAAGSLLGWRWPECARRWVSPCPRPPGSGRCTAACARL